MVANENTQAVQRTARIAGLLYFVLAVLSAFGLVYVPSLLLVAGDAAASARNIVASESLFRLGFVSNLLAFTTNVFVAYYLYKLLKPVNGGMAGLMVILIAIGLGIAMLNELNQLAALLLLGGAVPLAGFTAEQTQSLATFFLELYAHGFSIAHIFWGLWLFPLGSLVFKSGFLPKVIGVLLIVSGVGYLVDFTIFFLFPGITLTVSEFTFVGEVILILWLLIRGVNVQQWEKRALAPAMAA